MRYCDDFVILEGDLAELEKIIPKITYFLNNKLKLELHPNKIVIRKLKQGIDFLGYIVFPHYRLVRTKTRRRIFTKMTKKIEEFKDGRIDNRTINQSLTSYLGVLSHSNSYNLQKELKNKVDFLA